MRGRAEWRTGIYSARYGGVDSDQARYRLLLENLRGAGARTAHFHTAIVCCFPNGDRLDAAGDCFGTIAYAPQGDNGFGYDPVFFVPELRKTFAQLTPEEKRHQPPRQRPACLRGGAENLSGKELRSIYGTDKQAESPAAGMAANLDTIVHVGKEVSGSSSSSTAGSA
mgnify:CR=1 FL=1